MTARAPAWNRHNVDETLLRQLYLDDRLSAPEVATYMGISPHVVYKRLAKWGIARSNSESHIGVQAMEDNPNWRGGRRVDSQGYIVVQTGPNQSIREHRLIAERKIGRSLQPGEVIHHLNGDRADNRPENIEILPSQSEHMRRHMTPEEARRRGKRRLAALAALQEEKTKP